MGFGDAVVPAPEHAEYPTLLAMPRPRLRVYARETVIAEKLHAMCDLGIANSRMKDFYDLWFLSSAFDFEAAGWARPSRRRSRGEAARFRVRSRWHSPWIRHESGKRVQWGAFLTRSRVADPALIFDEVVDRLAHFAGRFFSKSRPPDGRRNPTALEWRPA